MPKLTLQKGSKPAVTITRKAVKSKGLVYVAVANKKIRYPNGSSRIVYIGTTQGSAARIAASAAHKAQALLGFHGITHLEFFVVTSSAVGDVKTWEILERGLLIAFREMYGKPPVCNKTGLRTKWRDELKYFTLNGLNGVIQKYSELEPQRSYE